MKGTAKKIIPDVDPLEVRLYRKKGKKLLAIALYTFESPLSIAQIIRFLNSKSEIKILEGYIAVLEEIAKSQCKEALGERRVI